MKKLLVILLVSAAVSVSANAQIITPQILTDLNFSGTNAGFTGAAVIGSAGDYWNFLSSTPPKGNLLGTDGVTNTTLSISWSGGNFPYVPKGGGTPGNGTSLWANSPTPGITQGITNTNGVTHYTLSGFDPSQTYNFDFLTASDTNGRVTTLTLTGATTTSLSASMTPSDTTWVNGNEYIQFNNIAPDPDAGTISFVLSHGAGGEGDLNGLQIFQNIQTAPEPGTYALIGLGLAVLLVVRRFRFGHQV